jgi:hypothetical protein
MTNDPTRAEANARAAAVVSRVVGAVFGGYAFSASSVALAMVVLPLAFGLTRSESVILVPMIGFVLYLVVLLWAFSERRLRRVWGVLLSGTALCCGLLLWLSPLLATRIPIGAL